VLAYRGEISGENELGGNIGEGFKDKTSVRKPGMRKGEDVFVHDSVAKVEDIEVDLARGVSLGGGNTTEMPFDSLNRGEEIVRSSDVVNLNDGIVKIRRIRRTADGVGLVNRGLLEAGFGGVES